MKAFLSTGGGRSKGGSPVQCIEQAASHPLQLLFSFLFCLFWAPFLGLQAPRVRLLMLSRLDCLCLLLDSKNLHRSFLVNVFHPAMTFWPFEPAAE